MSSTSPNMPERQGRYQVTVDGHWMCLEDGVLVDYVDGRAIHDQWHDQQEGGPR